MTITGGKEYDKRRNNEAGKSGLPEAETSQ